MSDGRPTERRPTLTRDVRAWVEELERLLRNREEGILDEGPITEARQRELVARLRAQWKPGVGDGLAGAELVRPAGYGDFASTWQARRPSTKAPVLVSAFDPRALDQGFLLLSFLDGMEAMETLGRFGTGSPHIAQVLQVDESMLAWSFEKPARGSLAEGSTRGWSVRRKVALVVEIARALAYGHSQGLVHGGLRLESVGLAEDGRAVVHEFGLHRRPGDRLPPEEDPLTPYLAPEVRAGSMPDARSDVFALGRLAMALFFDLGPGAGLARLDSVDLDVLPADVAPILRRAVNPDAAMRQASAQELLFELESGQVKGPMISTSAAMDLERAVPAALRKRAGLAAVGLFALAFVATLVSRCADDSPPEAVEQVAAAPEATSAPTPAPEAAPVDPRSSEALAKGIGRFLPDEDVPGPYDHLEDLALRARLHFLDEAVELRGEISGRVAEVWQEQDDVALLALMAWTLERRGLDAERVAAIRDRLGQRRQASQVAGLPFELVRVPGEEPLWAASREVSQGLWAALLGDRPSFYVGDDLPVEQVNWCRALAFCNALSVAAGVEPIYAGVPDCVASEGRSVEQTRLAGGFRLPGAAEWQRAAAGGVQGQTAWVGEGPEALLRVAWLKDNGDNKTHPVGTLAENPAGLADVHGNVAEWIWEPAPAAEGTRFVSVRGGSWRFGERFARLSERSPKRPGDAESDIGLRPVWQGEPPVFARSETPRP